MPRAELRLVLTRSQRWREKDAAARTACRFATERSWVRFVFFQAEDGIRDLTVTGVQTCALPISGRVASAVRARGYLTRAEFLALCKWKTPRTAKRCALNSSQQVRDATQLSFSTADERVKIGILRLLDGVDWPTASVLLHFCDRQQHPVLDFRALWSLGIATPPPYTFEFWWAYVTFTRRLVG